MTAASPVPLRNLQDILCFENEKPFERRMPARSVFDVFAQSAKRYPDRVALTMVMNLADDEQPRRVRYDELLGLIRQVANLFYALAGPRPGVAFMLPGLIETHLTLWGAEAAGYVVPINPLLQPEFVAELIRSSEASILVALGPHPAFEIWEKALRVGELLPHLRLVCVTPEAGLAPNGVLEFQLALGQQPADRLLFERPGRDDELAAYFHTGGTTGAPKMVAHTHRNQIVAAFGGAVMLHMAATESYGGGLPLFHVAGTIVGGLSVFMTGAEVVVLTPTGFRNPAVIKHYWRLVERYRLTSAGGVPTVIGSVLDVPVAGADLSSVRLGVCGAASTPRALVERFEAVTGKRMHEILGMTETAGLTCIDPAMGDRTIGSVGFRLPYTEVEVHRRNPDGSLGVVCLPGEIGVLTVKGPTVSKGYRNPKQNQGIFQDGMLNSGDLAYSDEAGRIFIAGRVKDLIIRSGHNIDPLLIEGAMMSHPAVSMAAAVSEPDAYAGEIPVCYVTLRADSSVDAAQLREFAEAHIAERPAWPRHIYIVPAIPVTGVGKIFKPKLRVDAASRMLQRLLLDKFDIPDAQVDVSEGGVQGMRIFVTIPKSHENQINALQGELARYVFESSLRVAGT